MGYIQGTAGASPPHRCLSTFWQRWACAFTLDVLSFFTTIKDLLLAIAVFTSLPALYPLSKVGSVELFLIQIPNATFTICQSVRISLKDKSPAPTVQCTYTVYHTFNGLANLKLQCFKLNLDWRVRLGVGRVVFKGFCL